MANHKSISWSMIPGTGRLGRPVISRLAGRGSAGRLHQEYHQSSCSLLFISFFTPTNYSFSCSFLRRELQTKDILRELMFSFYLLTLGFLVIQRMRHCSKYGKALCVSLPRIFAIGTRQIKLSLIGSSFFAPSFPMFDNFELYL